MTHVAWESKLRSVIDNLYFKSVIILHSKHEMPGLLADYKIVVRSSMPRKLGGVRAYIRVGLLTHLVQELNVGTVHLKNLSDLKRAL